MLVLLLGVIILALSVCLWPSPTEEHPWSYWRSNLGFTFYLHSRTTGFLSFLQNFIHGDYLEILIYGPIFLKKSKPTGLILFHFMSIGLSTTQRRARMVDKETSRLARIGTYSDLLMKRVTQVCGWLQGKYPTNPSHICFNTSWKTRSLY